MKNTLALVLMVFGIVGCGSTLIGRIPDGIDLSDGWVDWENLYPSAIANGITTYDFNKESVSTSSKVFYKVDYENQRISFKSKGSPFFGLAKQSACPYPFVRMKSQLPKLCRKFFGGTVKKYPELETVGLMCDFGLRPKTQMIVVKNQNFSADCYTKNGELLARKNQKEVQDKYFAEQAEKLKLEVLERKKSKCREYGFKDDSDGMGLCLIELDKLAAIKNQSEQANQAQLNILQQQQAEAKRQREANALMNLGAIIGGAGTPAPSSTRSKVTTPSYPTYTSSRTVPSNQLCPQLASRLVKQEVVRGNRICYYQ